MNYIDEITNLQKQVEQNKLEDARLKEKLNNLKEEYDKLKKELEVFDVKEENLENEIKKLETELNEELSKCQEILK